MGREGTGKFVNRVQSVIKTSRACNEITYAEMLGSLELLKYDLIQAIVEEDDEKDCSTCKWEHDLVIENLESCPFRKICDSGLADMYETEEE